VRAYRSWLPEAVLEGAAGEQLLAEAVRDWSAKWFARKNLRLLEPLSRASRPPLSADQAIWLVLDGDLAIAVSASARNALAAMMLGAEADHLPGTDADRHILSDMTSACLDDLCRRLVQAFRLPPDGRWVELRGESPLIEEPFDCALGVDVGVPLVRFLMSAELVIALIKAGLPLPVRPASLRPLAAGMADQEVTVSASLGRCAMTLADFANLGLGDVLVFETDAGAVLPLSFDHGVAATTQCLVEQTGGRFNLKLLEPLAR
jgi:hypothetical protein